jgi:sulfur carrier protein ThiS
MAKITFRAFSQLRTKFQEKGVRNAHELDVPDGITPIELLRLYGIDENEMEAVFINHKVVRRDTVIHDGDRVSVVPAGGIPGHVAGYIGKKGID